MRVLLFPWGQGGGAGYTGRCLALATQLHAAGAAVAFADCGQTSMVEEAGLPVVATGRRPPHQPAAVPPYLAFASVERVYAAGARYYRPDRFDGDLDADLAAIDAYRPDVVVYDMSPTAAVAARARALPAVSLADADFVSPLPNAWMPWLRCSPDRVLPFPPALPVIQRALARRGLPAVEHAGQLLLGDLTLIPSAPCIDPVLGGPVDGDVRHVGPLYWDPPSAARDEVLDAPRGDRRRVYVTLGSGIMCSEDALANLIEACAGAPWDVYLSLGYAERDLPAVPANVRLGGFTGITRPIAWSDVVVSHGGYSTVMASLLLGRPGVVLPFMSEQEANARQMLEAAGAGLLLRHADADPATGRLTFRHRHTGPSASPTVPAADIRLTIEEVLSEPAYARRAAELSDELRVARDGSDLPAMVEEAAISRRSGGPAARRP